MQTRPRNLIYPTAYVCLWALTTWWLASHTSFEAEEAIAGFVLLALILPGLVLLLTLRSTPHAVEIKRPQREVVVLIAYLFFLAAVLVVGFGWIDKITAEPAHTLTKLAVKLVVFVALPALLIRTVGGYRWRELFPFSLRRHLIPAFGVSIAALLMQAVIGRGLRDIRAEHLPIPVLLLGLPVCFLYLFIEVGLVEEFLFRTLLQERLSAALRSKWGGLVVAALLFGLVHAPGFYLRPVQTQEALGAAPSLAMAIGYSIAITSLAGLFLGVLWTRTRNLAAVMIVHAATDLLPQFIPFLKTFRLLH